jgi:DNA mismatch repair protein MutS2
MDKRTFEALEYQALIELAARHVQTVPGQVRMRNLYPFTSREETIDALQITGECVTYLNTRGRFGFSGIEDPVPIVAGLRIEGTCLEPRQILALERLLLAAKEFKQSVKAAEATGLFPRLSLIASGIPDLKDLLSAIHGKILPGGEIDDNASSELRAIRRDLMERRNRIHRTLESILRSQTRAVQEEIVTFRGGRFVIPIRTDSRNLVPGVVHGLSSSGQTTFVEPMTVIDQNNDLVRLQEQEEIEVSRILLSITGLMRENLESIQTTLNIITEMDVAQAKAVFSIEFECSPPQISEGNWIYLHDARHVLLEHSLRVCGEKSVPISLELDENHHVLIISGPNAGGKTVILKTLGLMSLMAQSGFQVPAREATLPVFRQLFADIGDQQSIAANLSTFTAHMRNIAEMARQAQPSALILLDEVGTGTDPDEGEALAVAIIEFFRRIGAVTVASTHYPGLKMWASKTPGVRNASVEFDERTLRPTYRLILGIAGSSSGLEIAGRMHVPDSILAKAKTLVDPSSERAREYLRQLKETLDEQANLRSSLEEERAAVAEKYSRLEKDFEKKEEARRAEFKAALDRIVGEFKSESGQAIHKIKDRIEAARIKKAADSRAAELNRKSVKLYQNSGLMSGCKGSSDALSKDKNAASAEIREGDKVRIQSLDREGIVETIREGVYTVMIGPLRFRADRADLERSRHSPHSPPPVFQESEIPEKSEEAVSELKVIGLRADEAVDRVDKFLDRAFLAGAESIRIIHGHGKGILRNAIAKFLLGHPQVEGFSQAPPEKGGGGATIVQMKK